ncbi:MAG: complex I NDUFA9 subunit family protein [Pseudomonadota bacterium]
MTETSADKKTITVFGGSGFLGRHVAKALVERGYKVRAAVRHPEKAGHLAATHGPGNAEAVKADLRDPEAVATALKGASAAVNLVGILFESGKQTFQAVQFEGAKNVADACSAAGVPLVHVSAIGADARSASDYARAKAQAENAVLEALGEEAVILRPSIVFGPEDNFFNQFADMSKFSPALPLIGGGRTKFQPVYVGDVAEAVAKGIDGELTGGTIYELGGPDVLTFRECLEEMLKVVGRKRLFAPIPFWAAKIQGAIFEKLPKPLITRDQVRLLKRDNVVSTEAESENRTLGGIGITPKSVSEILPTYL